MIARSSTDATTPRISSDPCRSRLVARAARVRELLVALSNGRPAVSWTAGCRRALASMLEDLHRSGSAGVFDALERLDAALRLAGVDASRATGSHAGEVVRQGV